MLIAVCRRLARERPELGPLICSAFDDADRIVSSLAVRLGVQVPPETTLGPLRVIEELRAAVINDESICGPSD